MLRIYYVNHVTISLKNAGRFVVSMIEMLWGTLLQVKTYVIQYNLEILLFFYYVFNTLKHAST